MKIFAVSDIHIDYAENKDWLLNISAFDYQNDFLILAGDISHKIELITSAFKKLSACFKKVFFVSGNHDLWLPGTNYTDSLAKQKAISDIASNEGILTKSFQNEQIAIIPLLSWYDYSFGVPSAELKMKWVDFNACKWTNNYDDQSLTGYFHSQNEMITSKPNQKVITFSHFLPRIDVMPPYIPLERRFVYPVLGSEKLDRQIRHLNSSLHIYGHSHVNQEVKLEGIQYINNAYGYPAERRISRKKLIKVYQF